MMQGAPKFMDEDRWDITAKMVSTDPGQPPQADPETRTKLTPSCWRIALR